MQKEKVNFRRNSDGTEQFFPSLGLLFFDLDLVNFLVSSILFTRSRLFTKSTVILLHNNNKLGNRNCSLNRDDAVSLSDTHYTSAFYSICKEPSIDLLCHPFFWIFSKVAKNKTDCFQ